MKSVYILLTLSVAGLILTSCSKSRNPEDTGWEFAPQMYHSIPYDPLSQVEGETHPFNPHGINMRTPAPGSIARGQLDYVFIYPNTEEGAEMAGTELTSPLEKNAFNLAEGKRLYNIYCLPCHGTEGRSDGPVISMNPDDQRFPAPPVHFQNERVRNMTEGRMYHVITSGRNLMPPYAAQLNPRQRWKVVQYVEQLSQLQ